jgi:endonuclease/exonuclease/phosphatase (EEP) superfamily protein YafD
MSRIRPLRFLAPLVVGAAASAVVVPDLLRWDRRLPMIATVAWRPQAVAGAALGVAVLATSRPLRPSAAALGVVAGVGLAALGGRLRPATAAPGTGDLTILSLNVFTGNADTGAVAALIGREAPDLVVLPEAGCDYLDKLAPLVAELGYRGWAATPPGMPDIMGVVVFAGPRAGDVQVHPECDLRYRHLRVTGGVLGDRELLAVHATAPRNAWLARGWRRELALLGRWTRAERAPIVVGDLNATVDNRPMRAALGGCVSAAVGVDGLVGTYPSSLPRWFGIQIDHVFVPRGTTTHRFTVHDVAGTDHRGVVTTVRLPAE